MFKKGLAFLLAALMVLPVIPAKADGSEKVNSKDEMMYYIMIDRFYNGTGDNDYDRDMDNPLAFQGGDFSGIGKKLEHIKGMGFTSIILSPIFLNDSKGYDGSRIIDLSKTDKHFGTIAELKQLVGKAHKGGLKVIIDFPLNRVSPEHAWAKDPTKEGWLVEDSSDQAGRLAWNTDNQEVSAYLRETAAWWVKETNIDGYRIPELDGISLDFAKDFAADMKRANPDILLLGQAAGDDNKERLLAAGFNVLFDDGANEALRDAFSKPDQPAAKLVESLKSSHEMFPGQLAAYFDNEQMKRYTRDMVINKQFPGTRWKLALTYLYTQPEIPYMYYGTEIAVDGGEAPENRTFMNFRTDEELIDHITRLGEIRKSEKALSRGTLDVLYEKDGMMIFKREYDGDTIVTAINNTSKKQEVHIPAEKLHGDKELRGLVGTDMIRSSNGVYKFVMDRETAEVYKLADKSKLNMIAIASIFLVFGMFIVFLAAAWKRGKNKR